jgi:hypothetical protein
MRSFLIEEFMVHIQTTPNARTKKPVGPSTAARHYKALKIYFDWAPNQHPRKLTRWPIRYSHALLERCGVRVGAG